MSEKNTGRVTIPTNLDVVPETIELMKRWGADAIRDCDGTEFPEELTKTGAKIYATYYTTEKIMSGRRQTRMRCSSVIL
jgi:1,3-beta-galactosyl-N-acetylhexosamine phosphorylase